MGRLRLTLFLMLAVLVSHTTAQQHVLTTYSLEQGIPQSSIIALYQDYNGNMWLGSQGGITRYNGQKFESFDSRHGLAGNHVSTFMQDRSGRYWMGHRYKGITMLQHKKFLAINLTEERINCIREDEWGNIWFGTHGKGLFILPAGKEPQTENFIKYQLPADLSDFEVFDVSFFEGTALVGTEKGLLVINYDAALNEFSSNRLTPKNSGIPFLKIYSFARSAEQLWGLGEKGIFRIDVDNIQTIPDQVDYFPFTRSIDIYFLHNITLDEEGVLWGVHRNGVYRFTGHAYDFDFYGTNYKETETNAIYCDRENNIWIGTMNHGVMKYSDSRFRIHNKESGMVSNIVSSVENDREGKLWMATENGVSIFDGHDYKHLTFRDGLPHNSVSVLFEDSRGYMWMGYYDGYPLLRYDPDQELFQQFTTRDGLMNNSVLTIEEDSEGNIWFATLGFGVSKYSYPDELNEEKFETFTEEDGLCANSIWTIHADRDGRLWFGSDSEGLSMYDGKKFFSFNEKDGLSNSSPAAIAHDSKNNLWIASIGGGIFKYDGHQFFNYSIDKGLSSDSPFSIICDNDDIVWIGTNSGIDRFDPESETFKSYSREDGFLGIETNQNAICKNEQGIIWFGTMNGVVRFDPSEDVQNTIPPVTHVENIQLFFNEFDYQEYSDSIDAVSGLPLSLAFSHNLNHLTFECIGISHKAPEKIKYQYFLEKFDTEWNPVTEATSITYTNVPPGKYTFKVMACNNDGVWNEDAVQLAFVIYPPFWQTWWFRILILISIIASIILIFRLRLRSIKLQKTKLEQLVDDKTLELKHEAEERKSAQIRAEESDKLKTAFLANMSHEIRTPVNAIIGFSDLLKDPKVTQEDFDLYLEYITGGGQSLMNLINDIIDISKIEAGEMRISDEPCNLEKLLDEIFVTYQEQLKAKVKGNVELFLETPKNPIEGEILTDQHRLKQILSNLINNAVKFTEKGSITFGYHFLDENYLHFYVRDTGIGIPADKIDIIFHRFRQVEDAYTRNYDGTGLGLTISKKLSQLLGGDMWVDSEDGKGSNFSFSIPFQLTEESKKPVYALQDEEVAESLNEKCILVVEDEDSNYILIENMLQDFEVNLLRAEDGVKAVDYFHKNGRTIDLVLMDIKIPLLNGYDATREIKKIKSKVPIIAQTAYAMPSEKQHCIDAGCDDYISKPYNKDELLSVIQKNLVSCHSYY